MNKRVLLAWEIGGGRGHAYILAWIAGVLKTRGYEPVLAVQKLESLQSVEKEISGLDFLQGPIWPGVAGATHRSEGPTVTLGDVIADLGLRSPTAVRQMFRAWDRLIAYVRPAAVIADYAPGLLLAARGRVPTVAVGEGFSLPPASLKNFPLLRADAPQPKYDEVRLLEIVNACLRDADRPTLSYLPQILSADRSCTGSFAELDAYAHLRTQPNAGPWAPAWDRTADQEKRDLFCYFSIRAGFEAVVVRALQELTRHEIPVRVHMPQLNEKQRAFLTEIGVRVEPSPLPFAEIHRSTRLAVSLGSLSFVSCALVSGIPQIIFPLGVAKYIPANAIERLGVGRSIEVDKKNPLEPMLLAQVLIDAYRDEKSAALAKEVAPDFARRFDPRPEKVVADLVDQIA